MFAIVGLSCSSSVGPKKEAGTSFLGARDLSGGKSLVGVLLFCFIFYCTLIIGSVFSYMCYNRNIIISYYFIWQNEVRTLASSQNLGVHTRRRSVLQSRKKCSRRRQERRVNNVTSFWLTPPHPTRRENISPRVFLFEMSFCCIVWLL